VKKLIIILFLIISVCLLSGCSEEILGRIGILEIMLLNCFFGFLVAVVGVVIWLIIKNLKKDKESENKSNNKEMPGYDVAEQIKKLAELKEQGILTEEEFEQEKSKLLNK